MPLFAAAEIFSPPVLLVFSCCRETYRGSVPVIGPPWLYPSPSLCTIHFLLLPRTPLAAGFPPLLPIGSCNHTIGSFRMESGGRVR
ncbi:unnamed protein product [Staurois parvus]|uniref:Secreted protein n=1 Tax=Staurois parvus TaxID=386267 RepID=A0ABN9EGY7_9NEOB|nr:unnamed protein product [Staurois parvus]